MEPTGLSHCLEHQRAEKVTPTVIIYGDERMSAWTSAR